MKPPDELRRDLVGQWLKKAEEALTLTREVRVKVSAILAAYLQPTEPDEAEESLPEEPQAGD